MTFPPLDPLSTDFYQFTMAQGYWRRGMHHTRAVFELFFRTAPFEKDYAITAGLETAIEFLREWRLEEQHLDYLAHIEHHSKPVFSADFLAELQQLRFSGNVFGIPEGSVVFPHEPLLRLEVPLWLGQLVETSLLNIINFQTLIASKAVQLCVAANGAPIYEFGLRRAQGPNGGLMASRAAFIGGAVATSNVLAGKQFGLPVVGTHAHSWVSAFESELQAFRAYAELYPDDCTLLVDTYHSLTGIHHAIMVGLELQQKGFTLRGIRLDSGDLLELSQKARHLLDQAGLVETKIIASNSLNVKTISRLVKAEAPIDAWGVGTHLITAYDAPALNGVYKLTAIEAAAGWRYTLKCSDEPEKLSLPGRHQVRRYFTPEQTLHHDVIYDVDLGVEAEERLAFQDLLVPIFQEGKAVYTSPDLHAIRQHTQHSLQTVAEMPSPPLALYDKNVIALQQKLLQEV